MKLLDPKPLRLLKRDDVIDATALEAILDELEPSRRQIRRLAWIALLVVLPLIVIGIGIDIAIEGQPAVRDLVSTLLNPAIMGGLVAGVAVSIISARHARLVRVRRVMLRHRRCPHCGYGLTGVPAAADGSTVCPECACAWRLDDPALARPEALAGSSRRVMVILLLLGVLGTFAGVAAMLWFALR